MTVVVPRCFWCDEITDPDQCFISGGKVKCRKCRDLDKTETANCVIPGCTQPVEMDGDTCPECVTLFGSMLRPTESRLTAEEIRDRDTYVARAYYAQRSIR